MTQPPVPLQDSMFLRHVQVRWADCDANEHMRHTAYNDYAAHMRMCVFADHDFSMGAMRALDIGPILFREDSKYRREVRMQEWMSVDYAISGLSSNALRWNIRHTLRKETGETAAIIDVEGSWLGLTTRKLAVPPAQLVEFLQSLPRTDDFVVL